MSTQIEALQQKLDAKFYGEMIITKEGLTHIARLNGAWRVAWYGGEHDHGTTYKVGTIDQIEQYVNEITA